MSPSRKSPPSAVVGLDIGTDSIKVAEAKYGKDGITITALGIAQTPVGVIENEVITDPKALGSAIKALLAESGIKTKQVVSSVAGQSKVVVRIIEVPRMTRDELTETMKWEVERQVPFSPSEVVMDFQPLDKPDADPNAQNMEVLLAVAQQDLIDSHVQALLAAGLKPMAIDIEPLACSRSLIETSQNGLRDEVVAIVNIGANNTDLGVFEKGLLTFPSPPLSIAGMSFTREIAEVLGQTLEEAETMKKEYAAVKLDAFASAPTVGDQQADESDVQAAPVSEPTSFDTFAGPGLDFGVPFNQGDEQVRTDQPAADTDEQIGLAAEPASLSDFQDTIDGPIFDTPDAMGIPAFDIEQTTAPAGPAFDLGDDELASSTASAGPSFDLDDAEPVAPSFDLEEQTEDSEEPITPSFDLSDTDENADLGEPVVDQPTSKLASSGSTEDVIFEAITGVLVDLANELRRSIEYYSTRYSQMPQRVLLCGGTAKMPNLAEFLSEQLGIPVEVANPIKNLKIKVTNISDRYLSEIAPVFPVAIGLAIRDMIG
jgi:type IV pilus assembly protein PilM